VTPPPCYEVLHKTLDAVDVLRAQLTRDLLVIAKFLLLVFAIVN